MSFIAHLVRGEHLIWQPPGSPSAVYIIVIRVARDTSWADLHMFTFASSWTKRMPMPMPRANIRFEAWDYTDLERDAETANKGASSRYGFDAVRPPA